MTPENYAYRNSLFFLRNDFVGSNKWNIPDVPKCVLKDEELEDLRMIGFDKAKTDETHFHRIVHFYLYDYKFESVWKKPSDFTDKLKKFKAILTPDFSMYLEMHPLEKLHNVYRNRWIGAYYASKGLRVVPSVSWGAEDTFDYCFEGVEKHSTVSVSTYMVSEHGRTPAQKEMFMKGYNELLNRIEPERILCYNTPFSEMEGNIITVDYELSSWKHMADDMDKSYFNCANNNECDIITSRNTYQIKDLDCFGEHCNIRSATYPASHCDIIKQKLFDLIYVKGMGSAREGHPCIIFRGQRIFIHNELFDLDYVAPSGLTNRELMMRGKAPYGKDGRKINIHHINQEPDGDLEEMLSSTHSKNTAELHPNRNQPSKINRNEFRHYREAYWQYRLTRYMEDTE